MKIKGAAAGQKAQASQEISQGSQSGGQSGVDLSLRQEFQAALANFAEHHANLTNTSQLNLATFDNALGEGAAVRTPDYVPAPRPAAKGASERQKHSDVAQDTSTEQPVEATEHDSEDKNDDTKGKDKTDLDRKDCVSVPTQSADKIATVEAQAGAVQASNTNQANTQAPVVSGETPPAVAANLAAPMYSQNSTGYGDAAPKAQVAATAQGENQADHQEIDPSVTKQAQVPTAEVVTDPTITQAINPKSAIGQAPASLTTANVDPQAAIAALTQAALNQAISATLTQRFSVDGTSGQRIGDQLSNPTHIGASSSAINKADSSVNASSTNLLRSEAAFKSEAERSTQQLAKPSRIQPSKILERIESTIKEAARSRDGKTISVRLDPPDLGTVKVDVSLRDGSLHARISAENSQVAGLLREKAHDLQSMLRKLGLAVEKVSVSVQSHGGDFSQAFNETGNSGNQTPENQRKFNNFGSGSNFASPVAVVTPDGKGLMTVADGWVA